MIPSGWTMNTLVGWGAAWMFGGALLSALVGALVGRFGGSTRGIGSGLLLWGLGNLLVAGLVWVFVQFETTVLTLTASRCEPLSSDAQHPRYRLFYAVPARPGQPAHEASVGMHDGLCPESPMPVDALRLRKDALAGTAAQITGEYADDTPLAVVVTWSAFGLFAVFAGSLLLSHAGPVRPEKPKPALPAWRQGLGRLLGQLGLLLVLAALVAPHFLPGSTERSIAFGLRTGATAMGCWILAGLLARTMNLPVVAFLLLFVLAMLGVAELLLWA